MKLKITLVSENKIELPKGFNHLQQALIYNMLDKIPAEWLHEQGFQFKKRSFKMFTFSSFLEKAEFHIKKQTFIFPSVITFYISSPVTWILEQVATNITGKNEIILGDNCLYISSVEIIQDETVTSEKIRVNALTPIEVHSTLLKGDGTKKTYYYSPSEPEFRQLINENLKKKWAALLGKECPHDLSIEPVKLRLCKERKRNFKGTIIRGWTGHYMLESKPELLQFALAAGLGSRNSIGFGFVEVVKPKNFGDKK